MPSDQSVRRRILKQLLVITKVSEQINPSDYVQQISYLLDPVDLAVF